MFGDSGPDFFRLALHACIEPAHHALEFRKFLHQFSGEIALAQLRCADRGRISAEFFDQALKTFSFLQVRAQLGLKCNVRQIEQAVREFLLWSVSKNFASFKVARSTCSLPRRIRLSGSLSKWSRRRNGASFTVFVLQRILLVMPHHRAEHLVGKAQEFGIKAALNRLRVLQFAEIPMFWRSASSGL